MQNGPEAELPEFCRAIDVDGWGVPATKVEGSLFDAIAAEVAIAEAERRHSRREA